MYAADMTDASKESEAKPGAAKRSRISQTDVPGVSLKSALRVPTAIADNYASHPTRPIDVASALEMTPSSGPFRTLCGAAIGYGLTEGGPNASEISLTPLGQRVVTPTEVDDDARALREAALKPTVANQFYVKYDGSPLPPKNIAENVLATFDVPRDRTSDVFDLLLENARYVGLLKTIKDKDYVDIGGPLGRAKEAAAIEVDEAVEASADRADATAVRSEPAASLSAQREPEPSASAAPDAVPSPPKNAIFVGHGGNRKPTDQLVKILNEYGIPHKVAVDEPNGARPIPQKVADTMRECGAAVLVFTADREFFDREGNSIWRPSENVSHELGAASVLYGERIVIFKEAGVDLPSNFSSIGYIEFEKDKLSDKGMDLFRELVSMKILSVTVG